MINNITHVKSPVDQPYGSPRKKERHLILGDTKERPHGDDKLHTLQTEAPKKVSGRSLQQTFCSCLELREAIKTSSTPIFLVPANNRGGFRLELSSHNTVGHKAHLIVHTGTMSITYRRHAMRVSYTHLTLPTNREV